MNRKQISVLLLGKSNEKFFDELEYELQVKYPNHPSSFSTICEQELSPKVAYDKPTFSLKRKNTSNSKNINDDEMFYTIIFIDPKPDGSILRFFHYCCCDIPNLESFSKIGTKELVEQYRYYGVGAPKKSGYHEYIFVVYKHKQKKNIKPINVFKRGLFDFGKFVETYFKNEIPIAVTSYKSKYSEDTFKIYLKWTFQIFCCCRCN